MVKTAQRSAYCLALIGRACARQDPRDRRCRDEGSRAELGSRALRRGSSRRGERRADASAKASLNAIPRPELVPVPCRHARLSARRPAAPRACAPRMRGRGQRRTACSPSLMRPSTRDRGPVSASCAHEAHRVLTLGAGGLQVLLVGGQAHPQGLLRPTPSITDGALGNLSQRSCQASGVCAVSREVAIRQ